LSDDDVITDIILDKHGDYQVIRTNINENSECEKGDQNCDLNGKNHDKFENPNFENPQNLIVKREGQQPEHLLKRKKIEKKPIEEIDIECLDDEDDVDDNNNNNKETNQPINNSLINLKSQNLNKKSILNSPTS